MGCSANTPERSTMDRTAINTLLNERHEAFLKCLQTLPAKR